MFKIATPDVEKNVHQIVQQNPRMIIKKIYLYLCPHPSLGQQLLSPDFFHNQFCHSYSNLLKNDMQNMNFLVMRLGFTFLSGFIDSQNYRTWSTHNFHNVIEVLLRPI
jgi:hypothetical protein